MLYSNCTQNHLELFHRYESLFPFSELVHSNLFPEAKNDLLGATREMDFALYSNTFPSFFPQKIPSNFIAIKKGKNPIFKPNNFFCHPFQKRARKPNSLAPAHSHSLHPSFMATDEGGKVLCEGNRRAECMAKWQIQFPRILASSSSPFPPFSFVFMHRSVHPPSFIHSLSHSIHSLRCPLKSVPAPESRASSSLSWP
jgi:hypothetical protein